MMYAIEEVKSTALAKQLGGPPVFHDGSLKKLLIEDNWAVLSIEILSDKNPRLKKNTLVNLHLIGISSFYFTSKRLKQGIITIHDLDIRREDNGLQMRLESIDGDISAIQFERIELYEHGKKHN